MHFCCQIGCLGQKTTPGPCYSISADASVSLVVFQCNMLDLLFICGKQRELPDFLLQSLCFSCGESNKFFFVVKKQSVWMYVSCQLLLFFGWYLFFFAVLLEYVQAILVNINNRACTLKKVSGFSVRGNDIVLTCTEQLICLR